MLAQLREIDASEGVREVRSLTGMRMMERPLRLVLGVGVGLTVLGVSSYVKRRRLLQRQRH